MSAARRNDRRSLPHGVSVTLSQARVQPGMAEQASDWMQMLDDRLDECIATLDRERMAVEIIFRLCEGDDDNLIWVTIRGTAGASILGSHHQLDVDHLAYDRRVRDGDWVHAEPQVLLLPAPVRAAVLAWADHGSTSADPSPHEAPAISVLVRAATVNDLDAFRFVGMATWPSTYGPLAGAAFVVSGIDQHWSRDALMTPLAEGLGLVAVVDNKVVGVAQIDRSGDDLVLWKLYVVPWCQGRGVGRRLLDTVRARAGDLGLGLLTEYVAANTSAGHFYRANGFVDEAPRAGPSTGTEAVWLRRPMTTAGDRLPS